MLMQRSQLRERLIVRGPQLKQSCTPGVLLYKKLVYFTVVTAECSEVSDENGW